MIAGLIIGGVVGVTAGIFLMGILCANRHSDMREERDHLRQLLNHERAEATKARVRGWHG